MTPFQGSKLLKSRTLLFSLRKTLLAGKIAYISGLGTLMLDGEKLRLVLLPKVEKKCGLRKGVYSFSNTWLDGPQDLIQGIATEVEKPIVVFAHSDRPAWEVVTIWNKIRL
jgi:hypothetical protein